MDSYVKSSLIKDGEVQYEGKSCYTYENRLQISTLIRVQ
jgi:hypothetical protein